MAKWFRVEKTGKGLTEFQECNWGFHDFRLEWAKYDAKKDIAEVFLGYDTRTEGVLLRFIGVRCMDIRSDGEYGNSWLSESGFYLSDKDRITWIIESDTCDLNSEEIRKTTKEYAGWVEAEELHWAVTDADGVPVEMPADRIDQKWDIYGEISYHHFDLIPVEEE